MTIFFKIFRLNNNAVGERNATDAASRQPKKDKQKVQRKRKKIIKWMERGEEEQEGSKRYFYFSYFSAADINRVFQHGKVHIAYDEIG